MSWVARFGRWLAVIGIAWALRNNISHADCMDALRRSFRHRSMDAAWCEGIIEDAQARNRARMSRA